MAATNVETLTNPRDSLPNVYTGVTAREVDFVTRFNDNWDALRRILGIMRPIRKAPGTQLISYTASVELEDGDVGPGEVIPYSKATITKASKDNLTIEKYAKAVSFSLVPAKHSIKSTLKNMRKLSLFLSCSCKIKTQGHT